MSAPVLKNRDYRYLLRDFLNHSAFRSFGSIETKHLSGALNAPASLAYWLLNFHPELTNNDTLNVLIAGAYGPDSYDDGCWYATLPWLLGKPNLKVSVTLVGPELFKHESGARRITTPRGTQQTKGYRLISEMKPAELFAGTVEEYFSKYEDHPSFDVVMLFNPGLEPGDDRDWFSQGAIARLCSQNAAVALTSYCDAELHTDRWIAETFGFKPTEKTLTNPFRGLEHIGGAWANSLWELSPETPPADFSPDQNSLAELARFIAQAVSYNHLSHLPPALNIGKIVTGLRDVSTGTIVERAVQTPNQGVVVSLATGVFHVVDKSTAFGMLDSYPIEDGFLESYPGEDSYNFAHVKWATAVFMLALENFQEEISTGSREEFMTRMYKDITGQDMSEEEALDLMRMQGGPHGPSYPHWLRVLSHLGWDIESTIEEPEELEPAFYSGGLPVVCENYAFTPGDKGDVLAMEAFGMLENDYPDGVVLLFKTIFTKKVGELYFSCGGYLFWKGSWRPFAINKDMNGISKVIKQAETKFSFITPHPRYADDDAEIARALNCLTHGANPEEPQEYVSVGQGEWATFLPKAVLPPELLS